MKTNISLIALLSTEPVTINPFLQRCTLLSQSSVYSVISYPVASGGSTLSFVFSSRLVPLPFITLPGTHPYPNVLLMLRRASDRYLGPLYNVIAIRIYITNIHSAPVI